MNEQENCKINRRVNCKTRKRSIEALTENSDCDARSLNCNLTKRSSARDYVTVDSETDIARTAWIDNSFTNGAKPRQHNTIQSEVRGDLQTGGHNCKQVRNDNCEREILHTDSDLNSSDLWLAEINLSALETEAAINSKLQSPVLTGHLKNSVLNSEMITFGDKNHGTITSTTTTLQPEDVSDENEMTKPQDHVSDHLNMAEHVKNERDILDLSGDEDLFDDWVAESVSNRTESGKHSSDSARCDQKLDSVSPVHVKYKHSDNTPLLQRASVPVSTGRTVSLKDKLKNKLLQNASCDTPTRNTVEELRMDSISKARLEASQIRREWASDDVGPFYGLPIKVQQLLAANRKITKLYDWQEQCLQLPAVYEGRNLIYTLPTSGGKTLVAEILILRQILCKKKDALLILPYISIVQEKVRILSEFATELGFLVEEYAGSKGRFPPTKRRQKHSLYVATIEKGQSLVNCLIEAGRLSELGLVVVDELHMIGEGGSRGATMESTLLKILVTNDAPPQVIGMSATLNNIQDLANFLHAEVFFSDFRPVELTEYVKVEDNMYQVDNKALVPDDKLQHKKCITFSYSQESQQQDPDHLLNLVLEIIPDNSCLMFCPTKRYCENVALLLARLICKHHRHLSNIQREKRKALLQELYADGGGKLCPTLQFTVHFGVAYHHSGLTTDERRLIEDAYSDGVLCLLTCTSTLAAGVNLPAKRVILRSPFVGADFLKHSQYKQMTGRAGRAGIDSSGESILIAKKADMPKVLELLSGPQDVCHSSLMYHDGKGLRTLILCLIGLKIVDSTQSLLRFLERTLLAVQAAKLRVDMPMVTTVALYTLALEGLIIQKKPDGEPSVQEVAEATLRELRSTMKRMYGNGDSISLMRGFCSDSQQPPTDLNTQQQLVVGVSGCELQRADLTQASVGTQLKGVSQNISTPYPHHLKHNTHESQNTNPTQSSDGTQLKGVSQHILTPFPRQQRSFNCDEGYTQGEEECGVISGTCEAGAKSTLYTPPEHNLEITSLGKATFKGSVDLECDKRLYEDLRKAEQSLVVANYLHLLYLVTPYDLAKDLSPPWMIYLQQLGALSADELKVAELIGIPESYIVKKASGQMSRLTVDHLTVQRFYLTLMLYDLWQHKSVWDVAEKYQLPRGFVQNLLTSASSFASCVLRFCQELPEFWAYQDLLGNFAKRLAYCVSVELIPLMEVPGVKLGRAKQLYSAGYTSLQSLAAAESSTLVKNIQFLSHKAARQIISSAKVILEEKTEALLEQVEQLVPLPAPVPSSVSTYMTLKQ